MSASNEPKSSEAGARAGDGGRRSSGAGECFGGPRGAWTFGLTDHYRFDVGFFDTLRLVLVDTAGARRVVRGQHPGGIEDRYPSWWGHAPAALPLGSKGTTCPRPPPPSVPPEEPSLTGSEKPPKAAGVPADL